MSVEQTSALNFLQPFAETRTGLAKQKLLGYCASKQDIHVSAIITYFAIILTLLKLLKCKPAQAEL